MPSPSLSALPKRLLGKTDMDVTRLGFGAMEIRGPRIWGGREVCDEQADTILNAVLDAGINFIDTANDYGRSEEYIGRFIRHRRNEYFLATKCGCNVTRRDEHTDDTPHDFSRDNCFRGLEESLKRLKVDCVDLVQMHNPSVREAEQEEVLVTLMEMRAQGLTRWIGISAEAPELQTYIDWNAVDTLQIPYSALDRRHEDMIAKAHEAGIGIIVRGGVQQGEPGIGSGNRTRWEKFDKAGLNELLEEGETRTHFMLRFTLSHSGLDTTIVGTLNPEHLLANKQIVLQGGLPMDVYEEAKRRLAGIGELPIKTVG